MKRARFGGFLKGDGRRRMVGWKLLGGKLSVEDGSSQYGNGFYFGEKPMEWCWGFLVFLSGEMTDSGLKGYGSEKRKWVWITAERQARRPCFLLIVEKRKLGTYTS